MGDRPLVGVRISAATDLVHPSFAFAGLADLAAAGGLRLAVDLRRPSRGPAHHPFVARFSVDVPTGGGRFERAAVAVDFHDRAEFVCSTTLEHCDLYFKANLVESVTATAAGRAADRLRPFGPYFGCTPVHDRGRAARIVGSALAAERWRTRAGGRLDPVRLTRQGARRAARYRSRGAYTRFEAEPPGAADAPAPGAPWILFQSNTWEGAPELDAFRRELILALRAHFGPVFFGGFSDSEHARRAYPDVVVPRIPQTDYARLRQSIPIEVNTRGLHDCFSWRLGEAMASARAVVSQPQVPVPGFSIDASSGILVGDTVDDLVAHADALAGDWERVREHAARARRTYAEHVRPPVRMARLLDEVRSFVDGS